jgi:hypothetical protein
LTNCLTRPLTVGFKLPSPWQGCAYPWRYTRHKRPRIQALWVPPWYLASDPNLRRISKIGDLGMGGFGSGRHSGAKKGRVEAHVALNLIELQRAGALAPGASGTLSSGAEAQPTAAIAFRTSTADFTLTYHVADGASERSIAERVQLARVAAGFGGTRHYFRCPGPGCGRRVVVLYLASGLIRCRRCHGLAYESQREDARRRAERRADKARARLRYGLWRPFDVAPWLGPKGCGGPSFGACGLRSAPRTTLRTKHSWRDCGV